MKDEKDIKKLFREGMEEAPQGFNNRIMDKLAQEEKTNIQIMELAGSEEPSGNFTAQVMKKVKAETSYEKATMPWGAVWIGLTGVVAFVLVAIIGFTDANAPSTPASKGLHQFLTNSQTGFTILLALAMVVLIDQFYKRYRQLGNPI